MLRVHRFGFSGNPTCRELACAAGPRFTISSLRHCGLGTRKCATICWRRARNATNLLRQFPSVGPIQSACPVIVNHENFLRMQLSASRWRNIRWFGRKSATPDSNEDL
jgi:hypothetical protein